ncbi:MAG: phage tail tape measure protein [Alphaproteobacteria bacterium]|nr:phage tail tape measure protein [Alphaproteobacteria bacterium]
MRAELERAGVSTGKLADEEQRLARTAEALKRKYDALAQTNARMDAVKSRRADLRGQAVDALALGAAFAAPVKAAMDLETAQVRLGTVINATTRVGETQAQAQARALEASTRHAVAFSNNGLTNTNEMLNIKYAMNSAGLEASAADAGSEVAAKVAKVTAGDPERVGEIMARSYNKMGHQFAGTADDKMRKIGDLLTKAQFKYQIRDFGQLGESMKTSTPAVLANNVAMEQQIVLLGRLNSSGLEGGEAGTALTATLRGLSKASKEFNFDLAHTKDGQLDFIATFENLEAAIGGFDGMDQKTIDKLQDVFGDEGVKSIHLLGKESGKLRQDMKELEGSVGTVDKAYATFRKSSRGQMDILANSVTNLAASFGTVLLPGINAVVAPLATVARFAATLVETFPTLTTVVIGSATGLVGLKVATIALGYGWTFVVGGALALRKAVLALDIAYTLATGRTALFATATQTAAAKTALLGAGGVVKSVITGVVSFGASLWGLATKALPLVATGWRLLGLAFMANPIGFVIGTIAIAAGILIANWEHVGPFFGDLFNYVGNLWSDFKALFTGSSIVATIGEAWSGLGGFFGDLFGGIMARAGDLIKNLTSALIEPLRSLKGMLGSAWTSVFGEGDEPAKPAIGSALAANDNRPKLGGAVATFGAGSGAAGTVVPLRPSSTQGPAAGAAAPITVTSTITIHAAAGMDEKEIARLVKVAMQDAMREADAKRRAANYD